MQLVESYFSKKDKPLECSDLNKKNQLVIIPRAVEPTKELTSFLLTENKFAKTMSLFN